MKTKFSYYKLNIIPKAPVHHCYSSFTRANPAKLIHNIPITLTGISATIKLRCDWWSEQV